MHKSIFSIENMLYAISGIIILLAFAFPDQTTTLITGVNNVVQQSLDWFILLLINVLLFFIIYLAFSQYGKIIIGGPTATKEFSNISWFSMLFAAGLGVGLVLYGVAEPVTHTMSPPGGSFLEANSPHSARQALLSTFFNWGPHAWALYAITSLAFAYFGYNRATSMQTGNFIFDLMPFVKNHTALLVIIDVIAYIAVLFGVIATLSLGVINLSEGLIRLFPSIADGYLTEFRLMTLGVLAAVYTASASTDIGKGIKNLSNLNIALAFFLLVFVLFATDTTYVMRSFVTTTGDFLNNFLKISTDLRHFSKNEVWVENWSVAYYLWWIAFCPFIGIFVARISRGRTFKEFILCSLSLPSIAIFLWFSVFGGAAIHEIQIMGNTDLGNLILNNQEKGIYELFAIFPLTTFTTTIIIILSFVFLVTSADSAAYVMGMMAGGDENPRRKSRIISAMIVTFLTAYLLYAEYDNNFLRNITLIGATPYLIVIILQAIAFYKALRTYEHDQ